METTETDSEIVSLRKQLEDARASYRARDYAHHEDMKLLSMYLHERAAELDWRDFDNWVEDLNCKLNVPLTERNRQWSGEIIVRVSFEATREEARDSLEEIAWTLQHRAGGLDNVDYAVDETDAINLSEVY